MIRLGNLIEQTPFSALDPRRVFRYTLIGIVQALRDCH